MKYLIPVLCAVALVVLAGAEKKDAPKVVTEAPGVVVDYEKLERRDGLRYFEEKPFTGVAVWKHENGQKRFESTFKAGKAHGPTTAWYENGQKAFEGTCKAGNLLTTTVWKPNGEKCPDTNIVNGTGIACGYSENGQKNSEITWKDGKEHGLGTSWHENGQKRNEVTYRDGKKEGLLTRWYGNGQKYEEVTYKNGKYHGRYTRWYPNGQKRYEVTYRDGKEISGKKWDKDGNLTSEYP